VEENASWKKLEKAKNRKLGDILGANSLETHGTILHTTAPFFLLASLADFF